MTFDKIFKTAVQNIKSTASRMIKEEMNFSCQVVDIQTIQDDYTIYPNYEEVQQWLNTLLSTEIKSKPLTSQAIESMKLKGITQSKQVSDILLFIIVASETHVHIGINIPETFDIDRIDFITSFIKNRVYHITEYNRYLILNYAHDSPLKDKYDIQRDIFTELKTRKIYIDTSEDEVVYDFQ